MHTVLFLGASLTPILTCGASRRVGGDELRLTRAATDDRPAQLVHFIQERDGARALRWLAARPIDLVLLDARRETGLGEDAAREMLEKLFPEHESRALATRARTLVLVDGDSGGSRLAFLAGARRVADVLVAPSPDDVLDRVHTLVDGGRGRIALCLAGGGIEGLLYEVGVLRALDRFLPDRTVRDFDMFFGISAGSMLSAFLANGLTPEQIADGLRDGTDKLEPIHRRELFDPNVRDLGQRAWRMLGEIVGRGDARNPLSAMYRAIPISAFAGDGLRAWLKRQLSRDGMTDHFEETRRPLFVGATDQDTSEAVVFGEPGWTDVPIHQAVRASCALAPFYAPELIGGRYYIDGAFTRTTNMRVAVKHGATLCLLVDPLVPIYSTQAGHVHSRGGLFSTMQGLKSLINGRFDKAHATIAEMYPGVAFHLFRPEDDEMRILSGSPMKFLYRPEVESLAYERTVKKIRAMLPRMQRDFARHGVLFREGPLGEGSDAFADGLTV